jgi:hypothetical protein
MTTMLTDKLLHLLGLPDSGCPNLEYLLEFKQPLIQSPARLGRFEWTSINSTLFSKLCA